MALRIDKGVLLRDIYELVILSTGAFYAHDTFKCLLDLLVIGEFKEVMLFFCDFSV